MFYCVFIIVVVLSLFGCVIVFDFIKVFDDEFFVGYFKVVVVGE